MRHALDDEREIQRLLISYAYAVDAKRYDDLDQIFTTDVKHHYGVSGATGITSLKRLIRSYLGRCGPTQHLLGSIVVDVTEHSARTSTYVQARHQGRGLRAAFSFDANGVYHDVLERRPEGWRIVSRTADWLAFRGQAFTFFRLSRR